VVTVYKIGNVQASRDAAVAVTSHGCPAARLVSVLVGIQAHTGRQ
jgi:hypothetical protein